MHRYQQRQRRVESARYADDGALAPRMFETLHQTAALYLEYLGTALLARSLVRGDEGHGVDRASEIVAILGIDGLDLHHAHGGRSLIFEGIACRAARREQIGVDIGHGQHALAREASGLFHYAAVLGDDSIAGEDQIGRRLAAPRRSVYVCGHGACRLLGYERAQIVVLADYLGRSRKVEHDLGAAHGHKRRRGHGRPQILAYLHAELHAVEREEQVAAEAALPACEHDRLVRNAVSRAEITRLVELVVIGDIGFRNRTPDIAAAHHDGTVVQPVDDPYGHAHDRDDGQCRRSIRNLRQRSFGIVGELGHAQQIAARITRNRQLGKHDHAHALGRRTPHDLDDAGGVAGRIGYVALIGYGGRDSEKSEIHAPTVISPTVGRGL